MGAPVYRVPVSSPLATVTLSLDQTPFEASWTTTDVCSKACACVVVAWIDIRRERESGRHRS
jgi:hypothetical protein